MLDWRNFHGPAVASIQRCSPVFRLSGFEQELIDFLKKEVPDALSF